jgi:hypothetical protein
MGINDVGIIGVGKDTYNEHLPGMVDGRILPWVEDVQDDGFPVWTDYDADQRSTYFIDRDGELIYQFDITTLDPTEPEDYEYLINLIVDFRAENGPSVFRIPEDTSSIQGAIEWAENGDIILISPGTYQERIDFLDKNITIASLLYSGFDPSLLSATILDGNLEGTVVTIAGGQDQTTILLGLTLENGYGIQSGGGLLIENASPTIDRNIIRNNNAGNCGGEGAGMAILGESFPFILGNEIHNNIVSGVCDCICYFGGGIFVDSTAFPVIGGSETLGNVFYENYGDYGFDLYRQPPADTTEWTPIFAQHNIFNECPPDFVAHVYPQNGWDLENCHTILDIDHEEELIVNKFELLSNFPNPFNLSTIIQFTIKAESQERVTLQLFDMMGREIEILMNETIKSGQYEIPWNASNYPSGIYFIHLRSGEFSRTQKALLVK